MVRMSNERYAFFVVETHILLNVFPLFLQHSLLTSLPINGTFHTSLTQQGHVTFVLFNCLALSDVCSDDK